jgi:hypothetical protein
MGAAYTQRASAPFLPRAEARGLLAEIDKLPVTCSLIDAHHQSGLVSECSASQADPVPDRSGTGLSATCARSRCSRRSSAASAVRAAAPRSAASAATSPRSASKATRSSLPSRPSSPASRAIQHSPDLLPVRYKGDRRERGNANVGRPVSWPSIRLVEVCATDHRPHPGKPPRPSPCHIYLVSGVPSMTPPNEGT